LVEVPDEDGFTFDLEQDSLADCMGAKIPARSLMVISSPVGGGKSLISQRLTFGLLENGAKVVVVTTELTTRGWIEQMHSIGYWVTERIKSGKLLVISKYGTVAQSAPDVGLEEVLESEAVKVADFIIIDSASSIIPETLENGEQHALVERLRGFCAQGHTILLTCDSDQTDPELLQKLRGTAEVVLDLDHAIIGGAMTRTIVVTRFLRAAGPVQSTIGWRVEPGMGFIVDITAVS